MKILETERLALYEFTPEDVHFIMELVNTEGWLRFIGDRDVHSPEDALRYLTNGPMQGYAKQGFGFWAMRLRTDNTPIGMCGLMKRDTLPHADIGFALLPAYEGQGYAYEAASATVAYAQNTLGFDTLLAIVLPENTRSVRLLERLGLRFQSLQRMNEEELAVYALA